MVNDQEPRYRLVDAGGNVVGSLFAESDGTLKLQEGTSGNGNELALQSDGTVTASSLSLANSAIQTEVFSASGKAQQNVSVTGLSPGTRDAYLVYITATSEVGTQGSLNLTVNGNTSSDYKTVFSDGTSDVSTDGIELYSSDKPSANVSGFIIIKEAGIERVGFHGDVAPGQFDRITETFDTGGLQKNAWPISSIEFNATQGAGSYSIREIGVYRLNF